MQGLLALVLLALAACGPLPRPFGRDPGEAPSALAGGINPEAVAVPPVTGTTRPMGRLLAEYVVKTLEKEYEIPAAISGLDNSRYVLLGDVTVNEDPAAPSYASIEWVLSEREGAIVSTFASDIPVTRTEWEYGSAALLEKVGDTIGTRVAKLVLGDRFGTAGVDRYLGKSGVYVRAVEGAPGDGNTALRRAMTVALGGAGLKLVNTPENAAFTVDAEVDVGPPEAGAQAVRIIWRVTDVGGALLGRAEQANAVPAGSLDGRWGQTAAFVAAAAMEGITNIVAEHDPSRLRVPDLGSGPYRPPERRAPPAPSLQRVPGRAPPPPS